MRKISHLTYNPIRMQVEGNFYNICGVALATLEATVDFDKI